jgi:hypothetical protein
MGPPRLFFLGRCKKWDGSCSCYNSRPLIRERADNNKSFRVDYLFEHDGCKVYRFYDHGYVYFTNCNGETIARTDSTETRNSIRKF